MSYQHHESWRMHLAEAMEEELAHPTDSPPDLHDVIAADAVVRKVLQDLTAESGIQPSAVGHTPLERCLPLALNLYKVQSMRVCRPRVRKTFAPKAKATPKAAAISPERTVGKHARRRRAKQEKLVAKDQETQSEIANLKSELARSSPTTTNVPPKGARTEKTKV